MLLAFSVDVDERCFCSDENMWSFFFAGVRKKERSRSRRYDQSYLVLDQNCYAAVLSCYAILQLKILSINTMVTFKDTSLT